MGLDMYGYTMRAEFVGERQTDVKVETKAEKLEAGISHFAYWRKFNHLHGWMENLYYDKGGNEEPFNCANVRLNADDLDKLEQALDEDALEHTPGFFFGAEEIHPDDVADTRTFITQARAALANGVAVFYDCWW